MQNTGGKERAGQEDVDSDYLLVAVYSALRCGKVPRRTQTADRTHSREALLRKIGGSHQGSIAGYKIA